MNKIMLKTVQCSLLIALAKIGSMLKISFIFGSLCAFFSAGSIITPLWGAFGGTFGVLIFFLFSFAKRIAFGHGLSLKIAAFYVPGLCAGLYWAQRSWIWAVAVPLLCMIAFSIHPVGSQAMIYTLYWFIPMILFCMTQQTRFTYALTATFIAHAVGSVLWLYAQPATPEFWIALLPIVACERLLYAVGMTVAHAFIATLCKQKQSTPRYRLLRA